MTTNTIKLKLGETVVTTQSCPFFRMRETLCNANCMYGATEVKVPENCPLKEQQGSVTILS